MQDLTANIQVAANWLRGLRPQTIISAAAFLLLIIELIFGVVSIAAVALLALALSPWILKFIGTIELPGGIKVTVRELEEVSRRAAQAGLLSQPTRDRATYEVIYNEDPTLALAGLRITLEEKLRQLATVSGHNEIAHGSVRRLSEGLVTAEVLTPQEAGVIADLLPLLNRAVHAQAFSSEAADWAMRNGPSLLSTIDQRIEAWRRRGHNNSPE